MRIELDDRGVTRTLPAGEPQHLAWSDVALVLLVWTPDCDRNPLSEVGHVELHALDGRWVPIPFREARRVRLIEHLALLPGFPRLDAERAMRRRDNPGHLSLWTRSPLRCPQCQQHHVLPEPQPVAGRWDALFRCPGCAAMVPLGRRYLGTD